MIIPYYIWILLGGAFIAQLVLADDDESGSGSQSGGSEGSIDGSFGNDILEGTSGPDLIRGFKGDDILAGNGGMDELRGGEGDDLITGGAERDVLDGDAGADQLFGMGGNDTIEGDGGNDYIDAGEGNDIVRGGQGDDTILGNLGRDTLRGADGDDDIFLWGEGGTAYGGADNDELVMVTGRGTLDGVAGDNVYYALANDDDTQQTVAIISELRLGDTVVLTIDTSDAAAESADLQVTVTEGTINGVEGYNIAVSFANPADEPGAGETFETARAFVLGRSLPIADVAAAVAVDVTVDAGLSTAEAQQTFIDVKAGAAAPAVSVV